MPQTRATRRQHCFTWDAKSDDVIPTSMLRLSSSACDATSGSVIHISGVCTSGVQNSQKWWVASLLLRVTVRVVVAAVALAARVRETSMRNNAQTNPV